MTVFKGFILMVKRNIGTLIMYMGIFVSICILVQMMTKGKGMADFEEQSLDIAVIDRDGGELAKGLTDYLGERHNLVEVEDDKTAIQENLFYRNIYYVVTIPEDFEKVCLENDGTLKTTKIPGTTSAFYVDQQINTFLNSVKVLKSSGFSTKEAISSAVDAGETKSEITLIDKNGHGGTVMPHAFLFQSLPYSVLSVLCYTIGTLMIAFRKKDVRRRMLCSAVSGRMQNAQLVLGYIVLGIGFWCICLLLPVIMYRMDFLTDPNLLYYLVNSFLIVLVALAIAFAIGVFVQREEVLNGVVNVISLGMCFTCGAFVSLDVLGKSVRTFSQFLPMYWYETVNNVISTNMDFTKAQQMLIFKGMGIQLLFAVAILCVGLVISKSKEQE